MYHLAIRRDFVAYHLHQHDNWENNEEHPHNYLIELDLTGRSLDQNNQLVDLPVLNASLERVLIRYRERTLNDLPEFTRKNPSVELFSSILCRALADEIIQENLTRVTVRLWENEQTWASYDVDY
jgi:6-pyruvoyltetrahydropterin/6-carboxytetrahydropterin synthase